VVRTAIDFSSYWFLIFFLTTEERRDRREQGREREKHRAKADFIIFFFLLSPLRFSHSRRTWMQAEQNVFLFCKIGLHFL
jgi:hypothetical protein